MDFKEFKEQVKVRVSTELGAKVFLKEVPKNNGIIRSGLVISTGNSNVSPTVYLDSCFEDYQNGADIGSIADSICNEIRSNEFNQPVDLSGFLEYETAGKKIVFRLVNYEKNRVRLKEIPHRRFLDLAIIYYYLVSEEPLGGKAVVQINNRHMEVWGATEEVLYKTALENTPVLLPYDIRSMDVYMREMLEEGIVGNYAGNDAMTKLCAQYILSETIFRFRNKIPMYVMTNQDILMGASCMLYPGIVKEFAGKMHSDLYILPSSVHETIIVPAEENIDPEELKKIVPEINMKQVEEEEQLSDNVYIYRRAMDTIAIA